jgi:hypothetical protein
MPANPLLYILQDQLQYLPSIRLIGAYLYLYVYYLILYLDINSLTATLPTIIKALNASPFIIWAGIIYILGQIVF